MFLFQLFLLINLSYILLLGICFLLVILIYPFALPVFSSVWILLLIVLLLGFFIVNSLTWRYRFFLYWFRFKRDLSAYAQFLYENAFFNHSRNARNLCLALSVYFLAGRRDYIDELLCKQEGFTAHRAFLLNALGYYLVQGNFEQGIKWLAQVKAPQSFVLKCTREILNFLQAPQLSDKREALQAFKKCFFEYKGYFKPKGYFCLKLIYIHLYQLVYQENLLVSDKKLALELSFSKCQRDYLSFKRYPLYFVALSFFWSQAISSLFDINSIK